MNVISLSSPSFVIPRFFGNFYDALSSPYFFNLCGIIFSLFLMTGCNGSDAPLVSHGGPVRNHASLVDALRAQGLTVEPTGPITQPFFRVPGQILKVNDQDIQVFEFEDPSAAQSQATKISPDGMSVGDTVLQWINPPHFFLSGKILVLYLGKDAELLKILKTALGEQIAGANTIFKNKQS